VALIAVVIIRPTGTSFMKKLPVLMSVPHGGLSIPLELADIVVLDEWEIFGEADAYTRDIYDLSASVRKWYDFDIARVFIDLNRPPHTFPPEVTDGVIKDITTYGVKIYKEGSGPGPELAGTLVKKYYKPYHDRLGEAMDDGIELGLDCHSMAAIAPPTARDAGSERPLICLGDVHGDTCPRETTTDFRKCLAEALDMDEKQISINRPFAGGHITRTYGSGKVPWIQIEISRALYLDPPGSHPSAINGSDNGIVKLNKALEKALRLFFKQLT